MYKGYVARFSHQRAKEAVGQLVPDLPRHLFFEYYDIVTRSPGYAPNQLHNLSALSFLVNNNTRYTFLAGLVGVMQLRPVVVLATEYFREGVAPGGKFKYDQGCATKLGANPCVEINPVVTLTRQMHQVFWE